MPKFGLSFFHFGVHTLSSGLYILVGLHTYIILWRNQLHYQYFSCICGCTDGVEIAGWPLWTNMHTYDTIKRDLNVQTGRDMIMNYYYNNQRIITVQKH